MNAMNRQATRNDMLAVLEDSVREAIGLKETLVEERSALTGQDLDALELAATSKGIKVDRLKSLEAERGAILERAGFAPGQMSDLAAWCGDDADITSRWDHLVALASECSSLNLTNGSIIRGRQGQLGQRLMILRGTTQGPGTYGIDGNESGGSARPLAEA